MIEQIYQFFTFEMIYLWLNIGVLPFWFVLIFFSQSNISRYLVTSIFPYLIFASIYIYLLFLFYRADYNFIDNFNLYLGIDDISDLFSNKAFLMMFWIHFISINLFVGGWIVKDGQKFSINKFLLLFPLVITYLIGPIGLFIYWLIRIFYAKSINLYD